MKWYVILRRWTWELPQTLLGFILTLCYKKHLIGSHTYRDQKVHFYSKFPGGISLGYYSLIKNNYKFLNPDSDIKKLMDTINHESGHGVQSKRWGPLYLPVIGLPSGIHNLICRYKASRNIPYDYYSFCAEAQADKLGGVVR